MYWFFCPPKCSATGCAHKMLKCSVKLRENTKSCVNSWWVHYYKRHLWLVLLKVNWACKNGFVIGTQFFFFTNTVYISDSQKKLCTCPCKHTHKVTGAHKGNLATVNVSTVDLQLLFSIWGMGEKGLLLLTGLHLRGSPRLPTFPSVPPQACRSVAGESTTLEICMI